MAFFVPFLVFQMMPDGVAVFRHGEWVQILPRTIGTNANRPLQGAHICMGGFALQHWCTHFQVTPGHGENPPA